MFWGMIGYGYKGPCHIWAAETDQDRLEAAKTIAEINTMVENECQRLEKEWKSSEEFQQLRTRELAKAQQLRKEAKV